MLILTVLFWFHHIVLFYACYVTLTKMLYSSVLESASNQELYLPTFRHQLYIFCSVSQQMFCVCCKTLMSCFQIITHWLHGQQKNLNISKYNCMYLCLKECLPWVFLHNYLRLFLHVTLYLLLNPAPYSFCCCGFWFSLFYFDLPFICQVSSFFSVFGGFCIF